MNESFKTFLSDAEAYEDCRTFWKLLWERVPAASRATWTSPWLNTTFEDGTEFRDGDGIFSAWSESSKRALKVIQVEPGTEELFEMWEQLWGDELRMLTIEVALSATTLGACETAIAAWCRGENPGENPAPG